MLTTLVHPDISDVEPLTVVCGVYSVGWVPGGGRGIQVALSNSFGSESMYIYGRTCRYHYINRRNISGMSDGRDSGGVPTKLGACTDCGATYPIHGKEDTWHPIGTDGTCTCGNDEFAPFNLD